MRRSCIGLKRGSPMPTRTLQLVLTKPIDWELVRQQYDQMVKYTTALRLGTAETEAIPAPLHPYQRATPGL